jgi:hypothetical protein
MKSKIVNEIGIYEEIIPSDFCDETIKQFEAAISGGFCIERQSSEGVSSSKKSDIAYGSTMSAMCNEAAGKMEALSGDGALFVHRVMKNIYQDYKNTFGILDDVKDVAIFHIKAQKTSPAQGYHVWHFEADSIPTATRLLAFIIYLNDVNDGGETEFLYKSMRVSPKKGSVVIFPCGFAHAHRGNPPLSGDKYVLTGWIEIAD